MGDDSMTAAGVGGGIFPVGGPPRANNAIRSSARRLSSLLRRIIGAPDYDAYLAHLTTCHPDREPLSRDEFERQRLEDRYSRPGSRCC